MTNINTEFEKKNVISRLILLLQKSRQNLKVVRSLCTSVQDFFIFKYRIIFIHKFTL